MSEIRAGSRIVTSGGRSGVAVWNPMQVRDGRLRVLCAFDGFDQVVDVDRLTLEGEKPARTVGDFDVWYQP